jgi:hypothetical protein
MSRNHPLSRQSREGWCNFAGPAKGGKCFNPSLILSKQYIGFSFREKYIHPRPMMQNAGPKRNVHIYIRYTGYTINAIVSCTDR